jgi:small subunit ribosomal protein S17
MSDETNTAETNTAETNAEPAATEARANRKVREGQVVSVGMQKTIVVTVVDRVRHGRYSKTVQRTTRLYAHDENNDAKVGDRVTIMETRPLSKLKRWRLVEVLERAR